LSGSQSFKPPALPEVDDVRLAWCTTDLPGSSPEVKRPPLPDGRAQSQQGKGTAGNGVFEGSMRRNLCT